MSTAKFETRKLNLIEMIVKLKDDEIVSQVENILLIEGKKSEVFSKSELQERVKKSENDILKKDYLSQIELEELSKSW